MASRALIARLRIASSSWLGSTRAGGRSGWLSKSNLHRRADRTLQQVGHPVEQAADLDRARLKVLAAGEGQQALDQRPGAAGGLQRAVDQPVALVAFGQPPSKQVEVADHGGEQIVEVVRHAAGQLAQRLELLRLVQLGERGLTLARALFDPRLERFIGALKVGAALAQILFDRLARVNILGRAIPFDDRAGLVTARHRARVHPVPAAILHADASFDIIGRAGGATMRPGRHRRLDVVGINCDLYVGADPRSAGPFEPARRHLLDLAVGRTRSTQPGGSVRLCAGSGPRFPEALPARARASYCRLRPRRADWPRLTNVVG